MVTRTTRLDLPDHTQLPESDGTFVKNFQEHPQSLLLSDSINQRLQQIHPDGQYCIGQDCGIYWRLTDPPERGAEAPDWFYVPNVPPTLNGEMRRSYVLWQEPTPPLIVLEFVSGNGNEERDKTPNEGKFWIYENVIRPKYYGIYEEKKASVEVYKLVNKKYRLMNKNANGRYSIKEIGVELGIWQGYYLYANLPWMRWWDENGNLLPTGAGSEQARIEQQRAEAERQRAEAEHQRAEAERQRAEAERQRAEEAERETALLREQLRSLGLLPESKENNF